jgi:hypothetical protein
MSCGNRFVCGMRRFDKYKISSDRPNNPVLHNENEQRLNQLLQEREELNKQLNPTSYIQSQPTPSIQINSFKSPQQINGKKNNEINTYTPWKTPSSS